MAESLPANYWQNLSYKEVAHWIWLIFWLMISAIILSSSYFIWVVWDTLLQTWAELLQIQVQEFWTAIFVSQLIILFILLVLLWFAYVFFDKEIKVISKDYIQTSFQMLKADTIDWLKTSAIDVMESTIEKLKDEPNKIHLQSTKEKIKIDWSEIFKDISSSAKVIKNIFTIKPKNTSLIWSIIVLTIFSYWDTFLWTFLPIFFTELLRAQSWWVANIPWSLLMLLFIIPVLFLFPIFAKLWDKYWRYYFIFGWLIVTCISVLLLWLTPYSVFYMFIIAWFLVWIWYVAWMSCAKPDLANKINEFVAVSWKRSQIDTNASAGPMMMINNIWNIIWPLVWGLLIDTIKFKWFFITFWVLLLIFIVYSFYKQKEILRPAYIFEEK